MSAVIPKDTTVGFVASGKMAQAMCKGFVSSGALKPSQITMSDPNKNNYAALEPLGVNMTQNNVTVVKQTKVVFIAVKPHIVRTVLKEIRNSVTKDHIIVCVAAGVTLESLESDLPEGTRVIRVMPNTPCLVQCGASVYCMGTHATQQDGALIKSLLVLLGFAEEIPEKLMAATIGICGSGVAYMYLAVEALSDGGVKNGLPRALSTKLAAQMMMGAAKMVLESGEHPGQLKDNVCSPGGTTIAAIAELERLGFRSSLIHAATASTNRVLELREADKRASEASQSSDEMPRKKRAM